MKLSANKAHKLARISKKTLLEALEKGTLSGEKNDKGHWLIDQSELLRVFPEHRFGQKPSQPKTPTENIQNAPENNVLEVELKAERDMRTRLEAEIEDLKVQRDKWQDQAKMLLIANQNAPDAKAERKGFFARVFG